MEGRLAALQQFFSRHAFRHSPLIYQIDLTFKSYVVQNSIPSESSKEVPRKTRKIVFVFDSNDEVGYGHEARCKKIEKALRRRQTWHTCAYGRIDTDPQECGDWDIVHRPWGTDGKPIREAAKEIIETGCSVVVCDANNRYHSKDDVRLLLEEIREHDKECSICVIDDIYENSIYNEKVERGNTPNLLILPYLHTRKHEYSVNEECRILKGVRYATVSPLRRKERRVFGGKKDLNILISFGKSKKGEDSAKRVAKVVDSLNLKHIGKIVVTASGCDIGMAKLVGTERDLTEICEDIDMAIIGSGTTKYEMLKWGIPMLTFAQFEDHITPSMEFADFGLCVYGGREDRLETTVLQRICKSFIEDEDARKKLMLAYAEMTDGQFDGADEIAREVEYIYNGYRRD